MAAATAFAPCLAANSRRQSHSEHRGAPNSATGFPDSPRICQHSLQAPLRYGLGGIGLTGSKGNKNICRCIESNESITTNGNVISFDAEASKLEDFIANAKDKLVVLDISTKTCGPCKLIFPKLVKMSIEYPDVIFLKINGDYSPETRALMRKWQVRAVPTFKFFRNGQMIHTHSGAKEDDLRSHFLIHYMATISM